jgi:tetratricopeptide (TPR) repeat protein
MSDPDYPYKDEAATLAQQGKVREALDWYDRALMTSPDNDVILNNMASALIYLGQPKEALGYVKRAAAINPASADLWINQGVALDKLDRLQEASEAFERAVAISPYNAYARAQLGILYQRMDMSDRADAQNRKLQEIVFPKGYAGLYFATAVFLLGILLGGIRAVEGADAAIAIASQVIILGFFCMVCALYWKSLTMWQEINRHIVGVPFLAAIRPEQGSKGRYIILVALGLVFCIGILMGCDVWNWLH